MKILTRNLKRLMPRSLFARALLILVVPVVLVQLVAVYVFYERHWDSVSRQMSVSLAGEVAWLVNRWDAADAPAVRKRILRQSEHYMGFGAKALEPMRMEDVGGKSEEFHFPKFEDNLRERIKNPFALRFVPALDRLKILISVDGAMLQIDVSEKRLVSPTTLIFIAWMGGASVVLLLIAVLFLRNQIRPIVQLSEAAERFGKGQETAGFQPSGAREVRQAGKAFLEMRERIRRQVEGRTAMLAGISHDLRTPLTRMKLHLAMQGDDAKHADLQEDVSEMGHMIDAYLAFARGEGVERTQKLGLIGWLEEVVTPYLRSHKPVTLQKITVTRAITLKPQAMKRVMQNLIDNALRYGKNCWVGAEIRRHALVLVVEDDGPGIPENERDNVFQAFRRLEASRNVSTGGAGLGLTIVRDIVHAHGGEVSLSKSSHGGLKVVVSLPL
jgi:two-component system osmolarity sensor histidine kinase EnvZ